MRNLASADTDLAGFVRGLSAAAAEVAPVAAVQGQLFVDLETTFGAFADVARPYIQETISKSPETEDTAIRTLPGDPAAAEEHHRPLRRPAPRLRRLRPAGYAPPRSPSPSASRRCALSPALNRQLDPTAQALLDFNNNANVREGIDDLDRLHPGAQPAARLRRPGPVGLQLRDAAVPQRRQPPQPSATASAPASASSPSSRPTGPNSEGSPSSAPANGGGRAIRPPTTCTPTRTRTPPRPARSASARPATRSTRRARSRSATSPATRAS